jgi:hypothetical protein
MSVDRPDSGDGEPTPVEEADEADDIGAIETVWPDEVSYDLPGPGDITGLDDQEGVPDIATSGDLGADGPPEF